MNNKIIDTSLYTGIQSSQFKFLKMLYRVIQTELLQEPVFAHCAPWDYLELPPYRRALPRHLRRPPHTQVVI